MKSLNWLLVLGLCMPLWLGSNVRAAQGSEPTVNLQIASQPLRDALGEFGRQSGLQVVFIQTDVGEAIISAPLAGAYSAQAALDRLLANTSLEYEFINERTVAVRAKGAPANGKATASEVYDGSTGGSMRLAQADTSADTGSSASGQGAQERQDTAGSGGSFEDAELEEILVTAQKRIERLQDVPVPVSTLSGEALTNTNQLRIEDYYKRIPGLALAVRGNGNSPAIYIRGVTTGGDANPTVGVVVDDVPYGASVVTGPNIITTADIDPGDLARVEVLRGPQGTLYGAASLGGLLKFVTIDPSTERLSGRLQVGSTSVNHGSDLGYSVRGNVNLPLSDTFAIRASGFTLQDPGYIDNVETGKRDVNQRDSKGGRVSALWRPSDVFSLKLSALIQESERPGTNDLDAALGTDSFQQSLLPGTGEYQRDTEAYSATITGKIGSAELVAATGYSVDESFDNLDTTAIWGPFIGFFFPVDRAVTLQRNTVKKFTQEVRATLPIGERLSWLVGAFYTDERAYITTDNQAAENTGSFVGSLLSNHYDPGKFEERAAFTNLTVELTPRWDVQFGGRYSESDQNLQLILDGAFVGGVTPQQRVTADDNAFTYLVTPRFKVSPDLMVYARLASGYRPGGPNAGCGVPNLPCKFGADTTENYEIGLKGSGHGLSYEASLYYIDWQDIQISNIQLPNSGGFFYTGNAGTAKSQGVELSLEAKPLAGLTLASWVTYNEAELTDDFTADGVVAEAGDRLPHSSRFSGNVSLDYEFPLWGTATGSIGSSLSYVGERTGKFRGVTNDVPPQRLPREKFPSYAQLDLRTGMRYDTWDLSLFVNNVTDKRGVLRGGADALLFPSYFNFIQPRTIGLSLAKSFE